MYHKGDIVLSSCFAPFHMPNCRAILGLLDKAMQVKVIDNVLDATEWERSSITFEQLNISVHIGLLKLYKISMLVHIGLLILRKNISLQPNTLDC